MQNSNINPVLLIISGVHKAGTTSLFKYLSSHSRISPSTIKETHFFTPIRFGEKPSKIENYWKLFKPNKTHLLNLEASPSYLYGGRYLGNYIKNKVDTDVKSIIILRNPSSRFISFYKHGIYTLELNKNLSLKEFIETSYNECSKPLIDNKTSRGIREGFYIDYIKEWTEVFQNNNKIIFFEDLISNAQGTIDELTTWLGIEKEQINGLNEIENKTSDYKIEFIHSLSIKINASFSSFFIKNPAIKKYIRKAYQIINNKEVKKQNFQLEKELLNSIYKEKNLELKEYLINNNLCKKLPDWLS